MSKKICITFLLIIIIIATVFTVANIQSGASENDIDYLRIHVRANSNSDEDQEVKYLVKDDVVAFLTPYVKDCTSMKEALKKVEGLESEIAEVCERSLESYGYYYGAKVEVKSEEFPTRVYGDLTLYEGVYDALIIELGTGKGDNWWCVIYPPLCFTSSSQSVEYRSFLYDIFNKLKNR